jgi:hypothetical protein
MGIENIAEIGFTDNPALDVPMVYTGQDSTERHDTSVLTVIYYNTEEDLTTPLGLVTVHL